MRHVRTGVIIIGIFLIGLGIYALFYDQMSYSNREKIIEIGPVQATVERGSTCVRLPAIFGALVIIAGGALVALHFAKRE